MNKNIFKHRFGLLALLLLAMLSITVTSCKDDEEGYGAPEITGIRACDPEKADSLFSKAGCGSVIAVMGNNLSDVRNVYINDQNVSFNSTMNTPHSLIVTIPTEEKGFKLTAFNSDLKDELRIETSHGTATYQFKVLAPGPSMSRIAALYPRNAGNVMTVYGYNLVDIEKVYLTDVTGDALDTTAWKPNEVPGNHVACEYKTVKADHAINSDTQAYRTTSVVDVTVPEGAPEHGALVFECAAGTTYLNFNHLPGKPVILTCSNDMPEIGETLVLTGRDFTQIDKISYGDVTLTEANGDYTVAESEDSIFIPFNKKPSVEGNNMVLTVSNPAGNATVDRFYDYTTILTTFDNDDAINNGWDPDCKYVNSRTDDGFFARMKYSGGQTWWGNMIFFRKDWNGNIFQFSDNIPTSAKADELYLTMNVYDEGEFNNGSFWGYLRYTILDIKQQLNSSGELEYIVLGQYDNFDWAEGGYDSNPQVGKYPDGPVLQDINGKIYKNKWYRAVVPLSKFDCFNGKNLGEFKSVGIPQFRIQLINQSTTTGNINVKFDNIRVIYIPKK